MNGNKTEVKEYLDEYAPLIEKTISRFEKSGDKELELYLVIERGLSAGIRKAEFSELYEGISVEIG
ncbi:MAG: hypothetical protein ACXQS2_00270, partial [Methermicoccaceae archaeon]